MARIIPPRVNNSRPLSSVTTGMTVEYQTDIFTIVARVKSEMTPKGMLLTFTVVEKPGILRGFAHTRVRLVCY